MTDVIAKFLAPFLEKFKLASPKAFAIVAAVLLTLFYFAMQGNVFGVFTLPAWAADSLKWLTQIAGLLFSTQTFRYLPASLQAKRDKITRAEG